MARKEARLSVTVWDDRDFIARSSAAQRWYFFLISQKDLTHAGVIPLRERRWAKSCSDGQEGLDAALAELEEHRFIVIDRDEGELLVRSLMRRDKVYQQPNVMLSAVDSVSSIGSQAIIDALFWEIARIEQEPLSAAQAASVAKMIDALSTRARELGIVRPGKPSASPTEKADENPSGNPSPNPSGIPSANLPGERGVVTVRTTNPVPPSPKAPQPAAARAPERDAPPSGQAEAIVQTWLGSLPKQPMAKLVNAIGQTVRAALSEGQDPGDVAEALRLWQERGNLGPGALPSLIHQVANGARPGTDLAIPATRASPRRESTTDARVADGLALAATLRAEEQR